MGQSIRFEQKGDFSKTFKFLKNAQKAINIRSFEKYGRMGVEALAAATPVDTGLTAKSWKYKINQSKNKITLSFENSNIQNGIPIAIILQYGHATRNGAWIEGIDYINPAIKPVFKQLKDEIWKEVTNP